MKLIYIGKESYNNRYKSLFKSRYVETIQYKNPLKAIDNLKEIDPQIVLMVFNDFPRLWKIVLTEVKSYSKNLTFILIGDLSKDDSKAFDYLKGDFLVPNNDNAINTLKDIIKPELPLNNTYFPEPEEFTIGFVNPVNFSFINGIVLEINKDLVIIKCDNESDIKDMNINETIKDASINFGDSIANIDLKIVEINDNITLEITNFNTQFENLLSILFV